MKISIVIIALLSILASLVLPWWVIAPICFAVAYFVKLKPLQAFLISFLAIMIIWLGAIYYFDFGTVKLLVGDLLELPSNLTPLISSIIGGLVAGIFGLAGSLFSKKPKRFVNG